MRASVLYDQRFEIEDRPRPVPGPGQVLLKTRVCGICGSDLHLFQHAKDIAKTAEEMGAPPTDLSTGIIMGHEYVGEIAEYGPDTKQAFPIGQKVVSVPFLLGADGALIPVGASPHVDGAYAEYFLGAEDLLLPIPDGVPDEAAALVEPLAIGVHAVAKSRVEPGHAAVILGCGPIGLAVAAVLKMKGVETIIASDFSNRRIELVQKMGATHFTKPDGESPYAICLESAPAAPVTIFDCTGAAPVLPQIIMDAPAGAEVIVAGIAPGEQSISPMIAISKELNIQFVIYYQPEEFAEALQAIAEDKLDWKPLVTAKVGLDGIPKAFDALSDPEGHAKILIEPWRDGALEPI